MNRQTWNRDNGFEAPVKGDASLKSSTTPEHRGRPCVYSGHRRCGDGSCVARVDMCPEEQLVNQNTIFILIAVGMVVIILLIILYCFQQRAQRRAQNRRANQRMSDQAASDGDNASLNMPPPAYDEVVSTSLYPLTPEMQRNVRISLSEEPRTPPPNYDAALYILAHSHDSVCPKKEERKSPLIRRSVSTELTQSGNSRVARSADPEFRRIYSTPEQR